MKRPVLALLDSETGYSLRFMEYTNKQKKTPFEVRAFTDAGKLHDFLQRHRAAVVLVSEKDMSKEIDEWTGGRAMILAEQKSGRQERSVFKYQAASEIMRDVMRKYGEEDRSELFCLQEESRSAFLKKETKVIGVFSPIGRCMKTAFSMTLGQCLARKKPTVLISMEACPAYEEIMHTEFESDLSEAFYYIRSGESRSAARILPLVRTVGTMDYFPPFRSLQELNAVSADEWNELITLLTHTSTYEAIVLDMGEIPLMMPELLDLCDVIYMPTRRDYVARSKMRAFMDQRLDEAAELTIGEALEERLRKMSFGEELLPESGDRWFESLPFSRMGRCAEECISRDEL